MKSSPKASIISQSFSKAPHGGEGSAELWIRPGDKGCGVLLLSGRSVTDSPLLSDRCCRHRSMHHTFVRAPLLRPPPFPLKLNTTVSPRVYLRAHRTPLQDERGARACRQWWQILAEPVSICESWHGELYESSASHRWICRACSGPVWWPWLPDGLIFSRGPRWRADMWSPSFEVQVEGLSNKEVRLTTAAWLGLSH